LQPEQFIRAIAEDADAHRSKSRDELFDCPRTSRAVASPTPLKFIFLKLRIAAWRGGFQPRCDWRFILLRFFDSICLQCR